MAITQERFDRLVSKLEEFSRNHPRSYRFRVALFAVLGYGYIFMMLAGSLGLIGLSILYIMYSPRVHTYIAYVIAFQVVIVILIVRSLWVTFPPPQGLKLNRRQVPQLFSLVDELTTELQAPKFHNIILNPEFNAAVVQIPRLGIFGWQKNYLLLGLPLMHSLSVEQFKAVLAHELGHLSGNHSRFAAWIYRVRKTWIQIYARFQQSHQEQDSVWSAIFTIWSGLFNIFLEWYWPAFNAYSFVLARMNEYEADRCAVQLAGANSMAEALINIELRTRFLESYFWPDIHKQTGHLAEPPEAYSSMLSVLHSPIAAEQSNQWLEEALSRKTNNIDTHPCLSDRLQSLGYLAPPAENLPVLVTSQINAAESLLGNSLEQFTQQFDREWQQVVATSWRQRYGYLADARLKLEALERNAQAQTLNEQELWERAYYTRELQGNEAALPLLQDLLKVQPNHAEANYALGQLFLQQADPGGVDYIEKAIAKRADWAVDGYQLIYSFFWQQGQTEAAEIYRQRAENHYQMILKAQQERADVFDRDKFKPHTLKAEEVSKLKQQLATFLEIKEAYLVEKIVHYFPEDRFCVLGIIRSKGIIESEVAPFKLVESLVKEIQFPVQAYIVVLNHGSSSGIRKNICQVERSLIFRKSR